jgi:phytoene synthase
VSQPVSQAITRKSASNLALAFVLLPRPQREAMAALYAFCREIDDIADNETTSATCRREQLARWREDIRRACNGQPPVFPVNRELQPYVGRYRLPYDLFDELLRGVEMDLDRQRYATYRDLEEYCYRVASVVGLLSIEIFGYRDPACRDYAVALGKALQFTNILRDIGGDAARGRVYLPLEALQQYGVGVDEIFRGAYSPRFRDLAASMAGRARAFYRQARDHLPAVDRRAMIAAELMGAVYWRLLVQLERQAFRVLAPTPIRLGKGRKLFLIMRTWFRLSTGQTVPNYG